MSLKNPLGAPRKKTDSIVKSSERHGLHAVQLGALRPSLSTANCDSKGKLWHCLCWQRCPSRTPAACNSRQGHREHGDNRWTTISELHATNNDNSGTAKQIYSATKYSGHGTFVMNRGRRKEKTEKKVTTSTSHDDRDVARRPAREIYWSIDLLIVTYVALLIVTYVDLLIMTMVALGWEWTTDSSQRGYYKKNPRFIVRLILNWS